LYGAHRLKNAGAAKQYREAILKVIDQIVPDYLPRTILGLADSYYLAGDIREAAFLCVDAARAARASGDFLTEYMALRHLAVIRSVEGDHFGALDDLERLLPAMRSIATTYPSEYYEHLNSLAVELGEVGRLEEANQAVDVVLRSALAPRYPHWQETKAELANKPHCVFIPLLFALGGRLTLFEPSNGAVSEESQNVAEAKTSPDRAPEPRYHSRSTQLRKSAVLPPLHLLSLGDSRDNVLARFPLSTDRSTLPRFGIFCPARAPPNSTSSF
jgi:hypothetical protein